MMNILKTICLFAIGMMVMSSGCEKSETISPDPNQCIKAIIIGGDCRNVHLDILNLSVGDNFTTLNGDRFNNVIAISNWPSNLPLQLKDTIYLNLVNKDILRLCPLEPINITPSKIFIGNNFSTLKCENDEN